MTKRIPPKVYADAPLFFNVIKRERGLWPASLKVLLAAQRGDIKLIASTLLLAEIIGHRGDVAPAVRDGVIEQYLTDLVEWVELDLFVVREARELGDRYKLRGPDASHLATAVRRKADYFMSRDLAFPYGQMVGDVKVIQPDVVWDPCFEDVEVNLRAEEEDAALRAAQEEASMRAAEAEGQAAKLAASAGAAALRNAQRRGVTVKMTPTLSIENTATSNPADPPAAGSTP